jgi:hydrogenase-4 component F
MSDLGGMALTALLAVPAGAALLLVGLSHYRLGAWLNVGAALLSLLAAVTLFGARPEANVYLRVDDFNVYLIFLNNLVSFTTSVFSAGYIAHELETGRLTPKYLRFYHAMYQALLFAMNLALLANNIGLLWVAIELATLVTVLMVGIYRTREALEAAWKYFILGSLGIALALFGTILVYLAAQPAMGQGLPAMAWDQLLVHAHAFRTGAGRIGNESRSGRPAAVGAQSGDSRGRCRFLQWLRTGDSCAE